MPDQPQPDRPPRVPPRPGRYGLRDIDPPPPPPEVLTRYGARMLDPVTAFGASRLRPLRPTVYVGDRLLVPATVWNDPRLRQLLVAVAGRGGLLPVPVADGERVAKVLSGYGVPAALAVQLVPLSEAPSYQADGWPVLAQFRYEAAAAGLAKEAAGVGLDHLLTAASGIGGVPIWGPTGLSGVPIWGPTGLSEYVRPGSGGRTPVTYVGPAPAQVDCRTRRPVVAVLDTGAGRHPWLPDDIVTRNVELDGLWAGHADPATDPEVGGDLTGPLDGQLDTASGHGTFIAGLIRQLCPDALIQAVRVMSSDGVVVESDLMRALGVLLGRLLRAQHHRGADGLLDVLVLSLGYYHERPQDPLFDPILLRMLTALGAAGVAVVAGAGNDATLRPFYPAAFTPHPGGLVAAAVPTVVPLVSVGGLNPDRSVALFSNAGPWVSSRAFGAAMVSTFPVTFNGGAAASADADDPSGLVRRTIDPDCYTSGFGTWSGTSFAAPVLAGQLAQWLLDAPGEHRKVPSLDEAGAEAAVRRGRSAVAAVTTIVTS